MDFTKRSKLSLLTTKMMNLSDNLILLEKDYLHDLGALDSFLTRRKDMKNKAYDFNPTYYKDRSYEQELIQDLKVLHITVKRRIRLLDEAKAKNVKAYNKLSEHRLENIIIYIRHYEYIHDQFKNEIKDLLIQVLQLGKTAGVYTIITTSLDNKDWPLFFELFFETL
jgi:hypothetical protein